MNIYKQLHFCFCLPKQNQASGQTLQVKQAHVHYYPNHALQTILILCGASHSILQRLRTKLNINYVFAR